MLHCNIIEPIAMGDVQVTDHERPGAHRERPQHVGTECGSDEPRRGEFGRGAHVSEPEPVRHRFTQRPVEHPQHDGDARIVGPIEPAITEPALHGDARLDVDHVVTGSARRWPARSTRASVRVSGMVAAPITIGMSSAWQRT